MTINKTKFEGLYIVESKVVPDSRGRLVKPFNILDYKNNGINVAFEELYYSYSEKNVFRGLHFQIPPFACSKLIFVNYGKIHDVSVDLRRGSKTYGEIFQIELSVDNNLAMFVPEGFAHGFYTTDSDAIVSSLQSKIYSNDHEGGIHGRCSGLDLDEFTLSNKDKLLVNLKEYNSPFHI